MRDEILENKIIENLKLRMAVDKMINEYEEECLKRVKILKIVAMFICCLILSLGVSYASEIKELIINFFNNTNSSIEKAAENGYIQEYDNDYCYDQEIGVKIDKIVLDNLNLNVQLGYKIKDENIKDIRIKDFIIMNDNNEIIYTSNLENVQNMERLAISDYLDWKELPRRIDNYTFEDSMLIGLRVGYVKFEKIKFDIKSIQINYENGERKEIFATWNLEVKINEDMINNKELNYSLKEKNKYIEKCNLKVDATGAVIELESKQEIPVDKYLMDLIVLKSDTKEYKCDYIDFNEWKMKIYFGEIGKYIENTESFDLYLDFFDTSIKLEK